MDFNVKPKERNISTRHCALEAHRDCHGQREKSTPEPDLLVDLTSRHKRKWTDVRDSELFFMFSPRFLPIHHIVKEQNHANEMYKSHVSAKGVI